MVGINDGVVDGMNAGVVEGMNAGVVEVMNGGVSGCLGVFENAGGVD